MIKELTCIRCPMGCALTVEVLDNGEVNVTGNTCPRGAEYGKKEVTNPTRIVTSTVWVEGGCENVVSVKTINDIPKGKIFDVMKDLSKVSVKAPVNMGDVVLTNVAGTGVDIVATKTVPAK